VLRVSLLQLLFLAGVICRVAHGQEAPSALVPVPAGPFTMGTQTGPRDERPAHQVELGPFGIERTPVTNGQFARFLNVRGGAGPGGRRFYDIDDRDARIHLRDGSYVADAGFADHPAVEVTWPGAREHCAWVGRRLPTEAEWEKAARGVDGRTFPWGDEPPDAERARFRAGWNETAPVGSFPRGASPYGVLDLSGNVWEWVSSLYRPYPYDPADGREDPEANGERATRGGGHDAEPPELTATARGRNLSRNPRSGHHNIGFRCAR